MKYYSKNGITEFHSITDAVDVVSDLAGYEVHFDGQSFLLLNDEAFLREIKYRMVDIVEQVYDDNPMFKEDAVHEYIYEFNFLYYSSRRRVPGNSLFHTAILLIDGNPFQNLLRANLMN